MAYDPEVLVRYSKACQEKEKAEEALLEMLGNPPEGDSTIRAIRELPPDWQREDYIQCLTVRHEIIDRRLMARLFRR